MPRKKKCCCGGSTCGCVFTLPICFRHREYLGTPPTSLVVDVKVPLIATAWPVAGIPRTVYAACYDIHRDAIDECNPATDERFVAFMFPDTCAFGQCPVACAAFIDPIPPCANTRCGAYWSCDSVMLAGDHRNCVASSTSFTLECVGNVFTRAYREVVGANSRNLYEYLAGDCP